MSRLSRHSGEALPVPTAGARSRWRARGQRKTGVVVWALVGLCAAVSARAVEPNELVVVDSAQKRVSVVDLESATPSAVSLSEDGLFATPLGVAVESSGDVLVVDSSADAVIRVDGETGAQSTVASGLPLSSPVAIALEPNGSILVADVGAGAIVRIDPSDGTQTILADSTPLSVPVGIAVSPTGAIFVSDQGASAVLAVDAVTGAAATLASGDSITQPAGIAFIGTGGAPALYVVDASLPGVLEIDATTGAQRVVAQVGNFIRPQGVVADAEGNALVSDVTANEIVKVDRVSGAQEVLVGSGLGDPFGLALLVRSPLQPVVLRQGDVVVGDTAGRSVVRIDPDDGAESVIASGGSLVEPRALVIEALGTIVAADAGAGALVVVEPATNGQLVLASGGDLSAPSGLAQLANGDLLVVDESGALVRVERTGGAQTRLLAPGALGDPSAIAIDGLGSVFVSEESAARVVSVDLDTLQLDVVASGDALLAPSGLVVEELGTLALVDRSSGALVRIDVATGAQTTLATGFDAPSSLGLGSDGVFVVADATGVSTFDPESGETMLLTHDDSELVASGVAVVPEPPGLRPGDVLVADAGAQALIRIAVDTLEQSILVAGSAVGTPTDVAVREDGTVWLIDTDAPAVLRVDVGSAGTTAFGATEGGPLDEPSAVAIAPSGEVYVADASGAVLRIDESSGEAVSFVSGLPLVGPAGLLALANGEALLVADPAAGSVFSVALPGGEVEELASGGILAAPVDVIETSDERVFVLDATADALIEIDRATGDQTVLAPSLGLGDARDLALDAMDRILVADADSSEILRVDSETGSVAPFVEGGLLQAPAGIEVAVTPFALTPGDAFFTDPTQAAVVRFRRSTGMQSVVSQGGMLISPIGIAVDQADRLIVSDGDARAILRIDPRDGSQTLVSSDGQLLSPAGVLVDGDGSILVADTGAGRILRVDPLSGLQQTLASGLPLRSPYGLAFDADRQLIVTDLGARAVLRVDPADGSAVAITAPSSLVAAPYEVVVGEDGTLFVAEAGAGRIVAIDPESGAIEPLTEAQSFVAPRGLAIDERGSLIVTDFATPQSLEPVLLRVGSSGQPATLAQATDFGDPTGLTYVIPEPGTAALAVAALFVLVGVLAGRTTRRRIGK